MFPKDHSGGSREDGLERKGGSGISESHISIQCHATELRRERESVNFRITRQVFLEEVGLELALEGFLEKEEEGYAKQGMSKGREVRLAKRMKRHLPFSLVPTSLLGPF